jgi:hypothetical protein
MALNSIKNNIAYGLNNALQNLSPLPIIAKRAPSSSDVAELGTYWIYNSQVYMFTGSSTWNQLLTSVSNKVSSSSTSVTNNSVVGTTTITGLTTAAAASFTVTLANSNVTTSSGVMVTASNLNASGNGASVAVTGIQTAANSMIITIKNNGSGALGSGDNVHIAHMVLN